MAKAKDNPNMVSVEDLVDLTDSNSADQFALAHNLSEVETNESGVIELDSDNSIVEPASTSTNLPVQNRKSNKQTQAKRQKMDASLKLDATQNMDATQKMDATQNTDATQTSSEKKSGFRHCPICLDPLFERLVASTICGHLYCMRCLKHYLLGNKRCPICRQDLKGKHSYHAVYLPGSN